jgi:hypothetical protein
MIAKHLALMTAFAFTTTSVAATPSPRPSSVLSTKAVRTDAEASGISGLGGGGGILILGAFGTAAAFVFYHTLLTGSGDGNEVADSN